MNPTLPPQQQRPPNQHRPQQQQGPPKLQLAKIADMKPNMNDVNVICIVLERKESVKTKEHTIHTFLVADETAAMNLTLWGEKAEGLIPGDIIRITGGYVGRSGYGLTQFSRCSIWKNYLSLYTGKKGGIERVGEYVNFIFLKQ